MLSQPSAPGGVGISKGLGNRLVVVVAISLFLLSTVLRRTHPRPGPGPSGTRPRRRRPTRPPGRLVVRRKGTDLLGSSPVGDHSPTAVGPDPYPDLLGVERLTRVVAQGPGREGAHRPRAGAPDEPR